MFNVNCTDIEDILQDYNIDSGIKCISELQRYHYESENPGSKQVRLIIKVDLEDAPPLVIRFKNEKDVTMELIECQSQFASILQKNDVITPSQYQTNGNFAKFYCINGYEVIVTVEQFVETEIKVVNTAIAKKTGKLLAKMHTISERNNLHIDNDVLFNPFERNDLFDYETFMTLENELKREDKMLFDKIVDKYNDYMEILAPLRKYQKYAVQGDISNCNLYYTCFGEVGIFDFNRSGNNILFCDAVMQALFEARLMDYPENSGCDFKEKILAGYCSVRSFSKEEKYFYPYLCAIIRAFWSSDIRWNKDSLLNAHKAGDSMSVRRWLLKIWERLVISD